MKTVAIHQPEYLPHLGLLDKAKRADVFVLLDDVQFNRDSLQQRAKIAKPGGGWQWLSIPYRHVGHPQEIRHVEPAEPWIERHRTMVLAAYGGAPAFDRAWRQFDYFYTIPWATVEGATTLSTVRLLEAFDVHTCLLHASNLQVEGAKSERVLNICKHLGATHYLCGATAAREYLDHAAFAAAGIEVVVQQFTPPKYREGLPDVSCLSALDAWMHLGERAKELLP